MESQLWSVTVHVGLWVTTLPTAHMWQQAGVPKTPVLKCLLSALQGLLFTVTYFFPFLSPHFTSTPNTKKLLPDAQS